MLRKIRILLAILFFVGITLLFLDFSGTVQPWLGWMAKLQFLPSVLALNIISVVAVLTLTLLVGRLYCSVICPLGVMQDVFAWIGKWRIFRKNKKTKFANKYSHSKPKTWLRLSVLGLMVIMLVAGFNAGFMLIAPYSAYGRIVSAGLQPIYIGINNMLAAWAEGADSYAFYHVEQHNNPMALCVVAGVSALILFVLAFRNGRTYCNTICPVGTVLGYVSKYSWFKMRVDESKCIKCGLCMKNCKTSCINVQKDEAITFDYTRCVDCGQCEIVCPKGAISFRKSAPNPNPSPARGKGVDSTLNETSGTGENVTTPFPRAEGTPMLITSEYVQRAGLGADLSRRSFMGVVGLAAAAAVNAQEKTTDGGFAAIEDKQIPKRKTPLTPPGSLSAQHLKQHCTACQLCISNCPNGVLRPNISLDGFLQPVMEYEKGFCRPECTRCSQVCPAGAIKPITVEEKTAIQIGHAVWVKKNCIPLRDGKTCGNCASKCPSGAIQMVPIDKSFKMNEEGKWVDAEGRPINEREILRIPVVNTEICIGCGACENLCPARPFSAIYVEGHEVHREI